MSEDHSSAGTQREELAAAFDGSLDPLAEHAATFDRLTVDPFSLFLTEALDPQNPADSTRTAYERLIRQWRGHMAREGRHPACPNPSHVESFVRYCRAQRENKPTTVRTKLRRLIKVYRYWQEDPVFPHPSEYNPFTLTLATLDLSSPPAKQPPRIPITDLGETVRSIRDIRDRAIIVLQLKLGVRASELSNIQLADLHLEQPELNQWYPELGTHECISDRPNAVYIPSRFDREKNKSRRPRILPVDRELQTVLRQYLLTRPDTGASWLLLTALTHDRINAEYVNRVWTDHFRPEYGATDDHRAVTSHFGRHRFSTYWRVEQDVNRELVKYMRGDTIRESARLTGEAIDDYLHTYYEDIEALYRERMFTLLA